MKRVIMMLVLLALVSSTGGCSSCNGLFQGGLISRFETFKTNMGIPHGNAVHSMLQDGPVRRWMRGDACDTCNVPAGQITFDEGFGSNCENGLCNPPTGEPIYGSPTPVGAPVTTGYTPMYGDAVGSSMPELNMGYQDSSFLNDPYSGGGDFGGVVDGVEIPPMGN